MNLIRVAYQRLRVGKKSRAEGGELRAMPAALEEPRAQAVFQCDDLLAESRLAHVQHLGRVAEVAQVSDSEKGAQEFEFHSRR